MTSRRKLPPDLAARVAHIRGKLTAFHDDGKRLFATSSFQTQSAVLLHILGGLPFKIPVLFLDTGYHFPETLRYRDQLMDAFWLDLIILRPAIPKSEQRNARGELLYTSDPDRCCDFNKVQPLLGVFRDYDIWINGVRRDQTEVRRQMQEEEEDGRGIHRYHPLLDWTAAMIEEYIERLRLPRHPLAPGAADSVGCEPCTTLIPGAGRQGRWAGMKKTECGLHTHPDKKP